MDKFLTNRTLMTFRIAACILASFFLFSCSKVDTPKAKQIDYTFTEPQVSGQSFYIDPVNGSMEGDGSVQNPWSTLQEVVEAGFIRCYSHTENYNPDSPLQLINEDAPVKGGDELILKSGYHGYLHVNNFIFQDWLTIKGEEGSEPVLSQIKMVGAFKKIYLKNFTVLKEAYQGEGNYWETETLNRNNGSCLYFSSSDFWGKGSDIKISGLTVKTTGNISEWIAEDWVEKAASGIGFRSVENAEVINCHVENISFGISLDYHSDHAQILNNTVKGYSGDGARIISNNVLFAYNTILDCYKVDDNHDDGIQSYSRGEDNSSGSGTLYNVIIRGNTIIGTTVPSHPLASSPQGIGCFDGLFDGWVVENNLVVSNTYHGISFYGMLNSTIANNTVIDLNPEDNVSPWIMITSHKNGTLSENCLIANNIASASVSVEGTNVEEANNYVIGKSNYDEVFILFKDPQNFDFHLLNNETTQENILDKGQFFGELRSSAIDLDQNSREGFPDLGAYEWFE